MANFSQASKYAADLIRAIECPNVSSGLRGFSARYADAIPPRVKLCWISFRYGEMPALGNAMAGVNLMPDNMLPMA